jgi:hypothetical protein
MYKGVLMIIFLSLSNPENDRGRSVCIGDRRVVWVYQKHRVLLQTNFIFEVEFYGSDKNVAQIMKTSHVCDNAQVCHAATEAVTPLPWKSEKIIIIARWKATK